MKKARGIVVSLLLLCAVLWTFWGQGFGPKKVASEGLSLDRKNGAPGYVFLISIDGWAYRHLWDRRLSMPNIRKLAKMGTWGDSRTVFPSMTWPSHVSMVTGQTPRHHGVLGNRWLRSYKEIFVPSWDNVEKLRKADTIYDLAHRAGLTTAAVMWPATQGSKTLTYNLPELTRSWLIKRYVDKKMKRLLWRSGVRSWGSLTRTMRQEGPATDRLAARVALRLIRKKKDRPRLFLIHFLSLDHAQHYTGTRVAKSRTLRAAAKLVDGLVGRLLKATQKAGIYRKSTFILASDHGFLESRHSIDARKLLIRAGLSRYHSLNSKRAAKEQVVAIPNGHAAFIYITRKSGPKRYKALRQKTLEALKKNRHIESIYLPRSYASLGLPTPAQDKGSPDLIALARPNSYFSRHRHGVVHRCSKVGFHGYLPSHPAMWTPFVAAGAGIKKDPKRRSIRNLDIAPTIARLLKLRFSKPVGGRLLSEVFKPRTRRYLARQMSPKKLAALSKKSE